MASVEEMDWIQETSNKTKAKQLGLKIVQEKTNVKQEDLEPVQNELMFKPVDVDLVPPNLRTKAQWEEIIPRGTKSKAHFTVTIPTETEMKFNEIMLYYQNQFKLGKVYKHYVLSIVIHDHYAKLQRSGQI